MIACSCKAKTVNIYLHLSSGAFPFLGLTTSKRRTHPIIATRPSQISWVLLKKRRDGGKPSREAASCNSPRATPETYLGAREAMERMMPRKVALTGWASACCVTVCPLKNSCMEQMRNAHIAIRPFTRCTDEMTPCLLELQKVQDICGCDFLTL